MRLVSRSPNTNRFRKLKQRSVENHERDPFCQTMDSCSQITRSIPGLIDISSRHAFQSFFDPLLHCALTSLILYSTMTGRSSSITNLPEPTYNLSCRSFNPGASVSNLICTTDIVSIKSRIVSQQLKTMWTGWQLSVRSTTMSWNAVTHMHFQSQSSWHSYLLESLSPHLPPC